MNTRLQSTVQDGADKFIEKYSVNVPGEWIDEFYRSSYNVPAPQLHNWDANQILVFDNGQAMGRYDLATDSVVKLTKKQVGNVYGVKPIGLEQIAAVEAMLNPDIQLIFLPGIAGSGKTFLASAGGLELIDGNAKTHQKVGTKARGGANKKKQTNASDYDAEDIEGYEFIVLLRPISYVGRSMGLVPGDADEKYFNFVAPVLKHLSVLAEQKLDYFVNEGRIIAQPIEYIRGAEFKNSIVILDEAQNCNVHEIKTIMTRIHHTSKLIVCGDTNQVDERGEMKVKNGLTEAMRCMQQGDDTDVAIVEFFQSKREGISLKAVQRMSDI